MIADINTNFLHLSDKLEVSFQPFYRRLTTKLEYLQIPYGILAGTKDIWCRDYMPVQVTENQFIQFRFDPWYLKTRYKHLKTDPAVVCNNIDLVTIPSGIVLDGGNVVKSENKVILTDQVLNDNKSFSESAIINQLSALFNGAQIIIIPKDPDDTYGHSDGMVKLIDDNRVLVSDYSKIAPSFHKQLISALFNAGLEIILMPFYPSYKINSCGDFQATGIYVNFVQIGQWILFPTFDNQAHDIIAIEIMEQIYPGRIVPINCIEPALDGGLLHCLTWNVLKSY